MSVAAAKWAKRQRVRTTCRVVLTALADFADKQGQCWPSQATLATETGLAVRTVRVVLAELTAAGVITRRHRGNGFGGRASDLIALTMDQDFDLAAVEQAPEDPAIPADDAGKGEGSYRQIKVGLAASHGRVSGTTCRGKNLPRTTKNYRPSRDEKSQEEPLYGHDTPAPGPLDPFGDDAFGPPPSDRGLDSDAWLDRDVASEGAR
jgi:hypothetical protein